MKDSLTHNCHIIPKRYMRGFAMEDWKIYYASLSNFKNIIITEKDWYNCDYWFHRDSYNFKDNEWNIIDWLEWYFAIREDKKWKELHGLLKKLRSNIEKWIKLSINDKKSVIRIISILYEKIVYYHYLFPLLKWKEILNEEWFYFINRLFISFKLYWWCFLKLLLTKKFKRIVLYSENPLFYFWDVPIHITTNWINNSLQDFILNEWSNLIFPLSKNFMIAIENRDDEHYGECCIEISEEFLKNYKDEDETKESLKSAVLKRIILNSQEYVAWPNKRLLNEALLSLKEKNIYSRDVFIYTTIEKAGSIFKPILKFINEELELIDKNILEKDISNWITKNYNIIKYIDKNLDEYKPIKYFSYILWLSESEILNIINNNRYEKILWDFKVFGNNLRDKILNDIY